MSHNKTSFHSSVSKALRSAPEGALVLIPDGCYTEVFSFASTPLLTGRNCCSILGKGKPVLLVTLTNVAYANVCGMNLMGNRDLHISNVHFRIQCRSFDAPRSYGGWFAGCTNLVIENCTFQVEVYGTNNTVKNLVFTEGATSVIVRNTAVITLNMTASNKLFHTATHDASLPLFSNVTFISRGLDALEVGDIALADCSANEMPVRQAGKRFGQLRIELGMDPTPYLLAPEDVVPVFDPFREWTYWSAGQQSRNAASNCVQRRASLVRIVNPAALMVGLQTRIKVESNSVYRLTGWARSVATNASPVLFGGRIACYLPPQPEKELVWMSEYTNWWRKELVFTNQVTGTAVVYVHMGYGNVASTGEFTDIRLERIE